MARKVKEEPEIEDLVVGIHGCAHSPSAHDTDMKRTRNVREGLLVWYDANRRKLPWRGDPPPFLSTATHTKKTNDAKKTKASAMMDAFVVRPVAVKTEELKSEPSVASASPRKVSPYETWVSEIMLQQTRVDTVVEYFLKWTDKFPTVEALANGSEEVGGVRRMANTCWTRQELTCCVRTGCECPVGWSRLLSPRSYAPRRCQIRDGELQRRTAIFD
jgi:hypothetical protein